jgi:hypothetical protein
MENNTFKYWMVANFEMLSAIAAGLLSVLLIPCFFNEEQHPDDSIGGRILVAFFLFALSCVQGKSRFFSLIKYIIILLFWIGSTFMTDEESKMPAIVIVLGWISLVAGTIVGIKLAIFTNRNIDEIVSRRMLYRNSKVDLFEITWVYTLDRFAGVASAIALCSTLMILMIFAIIF